MDSRPSEILGLVRIILSMSFFFFLLLRTNHGLLSKQAKATKKDVRLLCACGVT